MNKKGLVCLLLALGLFLALAGVTRLDGESIRLLAAGGCLLGALAGRASGAVKL